MNIIRPTIITEAMFQSSNIPEPEIGLYAEFLMDTTYADGETVIDSTGVEILTLDVKPATAWVVDRLLTGQTSTQTCRVVAKLTDYTYQVRERTGAFTLGEIIGVTGVGAELADQGVAYPTITAAINKVHKVYESLAAGNKSNYPPTDVLTATPKWFEIGSTNRWKVFDAKVQSQASQATMMNWVLNPGLIDSIALLNLDATSVQIIMADQATDLVTNGTAWTGAIGAIPPTGWTVESAAPTFTIDSGELKIEAGAGEGGCNQTMIVVPGTEMQLLGKYRNTAGDLTRYRIYDVTNSASILTTTDLPDSEVNSTISYVFTVPAGCTQVLIALLAKSAGDIVWFDTVSLSKVVYNKTTTTLVTINVIDWYSYFFEPIIRATDIMKTDLAAIDVPPISTASMTVIVTYTAGTAKCGEIVVGLKFQLGSMKYGPSIGIIDYSIKAVDAFGNMSITERAYSKRMSLDLLVKNTIVNEVFRQLALYRATPMVYVGSESYSALIVYGFYKSFEIVIPYPNYSECNLEIEGLT